MDPRRRRALQARVALWHDDRARLSDAFADPRLDAASILLAQNAQTYVALRTESRALRESRFRRVAGSRAGNGSRRERRKARMAGALADHRGDRRRCEAGVRGGDVVVVCRVVY